MTSSRTRVTRSATGLAVLGSGLLALAYPLSAELIHPLAMPALALGAVFAAISLDRVEIGVAAALFLVALTPGLVGAGAWVPGAAWTLLLVGVVAFRQGREDATHQLPPMSALVILNLGVIAVEFARAPDTGTAVPVLRSAVCGIALFFVLATQLRTRSQIQWAINGFLAGALLIGGTAILQLAGGGGKIGFLTETGQLVYRVSGGLGHPNQLGGFLVVLVPLAIASALAARTSRIFALTVAATAVMGIYASYSRGALLALAVAGIVFLRARTLVLAIPLVLLAAVTLAPDTLHERFETATSSGSELASRDDIWDTAVAIWEVDPIVGHGLGSFPSAYAESRAPGKDFLPNTLFLPPPHAHNVYLHLLAEQGLVGLLVFLAVVAAALGHAVRLRRSARPWISWYGRAILGAMAAFLIHNLLDVTLFEQTGIYFWAMLGLLSALVTAARATREQEPAPSLSQVVA